MIGLALPVEIRVERVVQEHAAGVKRADAGQQERELPEILFRMLTSPRGSCTTRSAGSTRGPK